MFNTKTDHLKTVKKILKSYIPEYEVWAFGSRTNGTSKEYSDLDLVLIGREKLDITKLRLWKKHSRNPTSPSG